MKPATILSLRTEDVVRDSRGSRGVVSGFACNAVRIKWEGGEPMSFSDDDLARYGVYKASPFDAEDTRPE